MIIYAFLTVCIFSVANGAWIIGRLKKAHRSVWIGLGRPSATLGTGLRPRLALVRFIWSHDFRRINDSCLSLACWAAIAAELLLAALLLLLVFGGK